MYDEIVFTNPNESFFQDLQALSEAPTIESEYSQSMHFTQFSDNDDVLALLEAQKFLQDQVALIKERYQRVNEELEAVDRELANVVEPSHKSSTVSHSKQQSRSPAGIGASSTKSVPSKVVGKKHKVTATVSKTLQPAVQGGGALATTMNASVLPPATSGGANKKAKTKDSKT